jgi:xanthine dehydrogenase accessory factor
MREVISEIVAWQKQNKPVAVATNVKMDGSSLRPLGSKMAMTTALDIAGSVTGGCIEGAVYEEGQAVIQSGVPKLLHYGVPNSDSPWEVGLNCGTSLDVFVETLAHPAWQEIFPSVQTCLEQNQLACVATVITGAGIGKKMMLWPDGRSIGSLGSPELDGLARPWLQGQMTVQEAGWKTFEVAGSPVEIFADVFVPPARLIVIGAVHIAIPLVKLAKELGFHTTVIDPRSAFANRERFPDVDELIVDWPADALEKLRLDEGSYIASLSHDEKLDNPALRVALTSPARYVGVLGTRKRVDKRMDDLRELGVPEEQLPRLHAPVGLNLGATLPDEIALSILAEMVAARHGVERNREIH